MKIAQYCFLSWTALPPSQEQFHQSESVEHHYGTDIYLAIEYTGKVWPHIVEQTFVMDKSLLNCLWCQHEDLVVIAIDGQIRRLILRAGVWALLVCKWALLTS